MPTPPKAFNHRSDLHAGEHEDVVAGVELLALPRFLAARDLDVEVALAREVDAEAGVRGSIRRRPGCDPCRSFAKTNGLMRWIQKFLPPPG